MSDVTAPRRAKDSPAQTTTTAPSSTPSPAPADFTAVHATGTLEALKLTVAGSLAEMIASASAAIDRRFYHFGLASDRDIEEVELFLNSVRDTVLSIGHMADQIAIRTGVGPGPVRGSATDWLLPPVVQDEMNNLGRAQIGGAEPEPRRVADDELSHSTMTAAVEYIEFAPTADTEPRAALDTVSQLLTSAIKTLGLLDDEADIISGQITLLCLARSAVDTLYPVIGKGGDDGR